jgi:hypothetical protein
MQQVCSWAGVPEAVQHAGGFLRPGARLMPLPNTAAGSCLVDAIVQGAYLHAHRQLLDVRHHRAQLCAASRSLREQVVMVALMSFVLSRGPLPCLVASYRIAANRCGLAVLNPFRANFGFVMHRQLRSLSVKWTGCVKMLPTR